MKPKDKRFIVIAALLAVFAVVGPKWHFRIQRDRGHYHFGYHRGEIAHLAPDRSPAPSSEPLVLDKRGWQFFEEGYSDAISQRPPRYPYAPLSIDFASFPSAASD